MSDTHGDLDPRIFDHFANVDEIWHAGDVGDVSVIDELSRFKPTRGVFGNIDGHVVRSVWPEWTDFKSDEMKVLITHIGGRPYKYSQKAFGLIHEKKPDVFVCGHSHILLVQFDKKINSMWLNPGACGHKGFHSVRTILRFEIHGKEMRNMEAIELGNRA